METRYPESQVGTIRSTPKFRIPVSAATVNSFPVTMRIPKLSVKLSTYAKGEARATLSYVPMVLSSIRSFWCVIGGIISIAVALKSCTV
jgi:hypothetical protein